MQENSTLAIKKEQTVRSGCSRSGGRSADGSAGVCGDAPSVSCVPVVPRLVQSPGASPLEPFQARTARHRRRWGRRGRTTARRPPPPATRTTPGRQDSARRRCSVTSSEGRCRAAAAAAAVARSGARASRRATRRRSKVVGVRAAVNGGRVERRAARLSIAYWSASPARGPSPEFSSNQSIACA